jgi:hypothetical protein
MTDTPLCETLHGTLIYLEPPGLMSQGETFRTVVEGRTQRTTKVGLTRSAIEKLLSKEGIKSGSI